MSNKAEIKKDQNKTENPVMSILDILVIVTSNLKLLYLTPSLLCFLTIIYVSFFAEPSYTSTSKIMSSSNQGAVGSAAGFAAQLGISMPLNTRGPNWVYSEILLSRTLARSVLNRKFDTYQFGEQVSLLEILTHDEEKIDLDDQVRKAIAINTYLGMVSVSKDPKTAILTLSVKAAEKRLSAGINKAIIEELNSHQKKYNKSKANETKQFIQGRILDTEKELIEAEEELKIFNDRNRRIGNSPELQLAQQRLSREVTVLIGVFTSLKQQLETTKIEEVKDSEYVVVLDPPNIPINRSTPKKKQLVIMAGILGVLTAVVVIFLKQFILITQKNEKDKINRLMKNIITFLPFVKSKNSI
jgi:uncharacterized protein involved in exopolysaccharide biosynthesis